jgi:hypothetical protein
VYSFTLVLKERQGTPLTFIHRKDTIAASNLTVLRSVDQAITWRLRPYEARRIPLTFTWGCTGGLGDCINPGNVAPMWTITLTGSDGQGRPVQASIAIKLPPNPDTYRQP